MASTDGWLKDQIKGLRSHAGSPGANAYNTVKTGTLGGIDATMPTPGTPGPRQNPGDAMGVRGSLADQPVVVAQASGDQRAMDYLQGGRSSLGAPSVLPPKQPNAIDNMMLDQVKSPLDRRGPEMGTPPVKKSMADEEVYTAARGGEFDTGDEVLVGEEGPEVVKFKQPGTVVPAAAITAAGVTDSVKTGLRKGMDTAKAGWDATKNFFTGGPEPVVGQGARAATPPFDPTRFPGGQSVPGGGGAAGARATGGVAEAAATGSKFARGLRGLGLIGAAVQAGTTGYEAGSMTGEVARGEFGATPDNRPARAARILTGGLWKPAGSGPGTGTPAAVPAATVQPQVGSIAGPSREAPAENFIVNNVTGKRTDIRPDYGVAAAEMRAGRESQEALAGYQPTESSAGMRSGRINPGIQAMGRVAAYGAAGRLAKNAADVGLRKEAVNVAREANQIAAAKASYDVRKDERNRADAQEKLHDEQFVRTIEGRARQNIDPSTLSSASGSYEQAVKQKAGALTDDYRHSAANMRGPQGQRLTLGQLSEGQVQQLHMMDDLRSRLKTARTTWGKAFSDYAGNKRTDSRDLNDYRPVGYERSSNPLVAKWIVMESGEKIPVVEAAGGGFNIFGPNDPMDKQLLEMADAAEARKRKGK